MLTLDKLAYRLAGATVGFVIGCLALLILFFIIQIVMEIFGVSRVRFRAPIAIVVLPFMAAFLDSGLVQICSCECRQCWGILSHGHGFCSSGRFFGQASFWLMFSFLTLSATISRTTSGFWLRRSFCSRQEFYGLALGYSKSLCLENKMVGYKGVAK
jgi:hypothetical protein